MNQKHVTIVLAHGAWADGSSWSKVIKARIALTQKLRRIIEEGYGLALEGISAADVARSAASGRWPNYAASASTRPGETAEFCGRTK
jgi:hypothetical protein